MTVSGKFKPRDRVRVHSWTPPGHVRTPYYVRGNVGVIESLAGAFRNPEELAYGRTDAPERPLYRVSFALSDLWPDRRARTGDRVVMDIFEHWLEPAH